jgi:hypothetical protein
MNYNFIFLLIEKYWIEISVYTVKNFIDFLPYGKR